MFPEQRRVAINARDVSTLATRSMNRAIDNADDLTQGIELDDAATGRAAEAMVWVRLSEQPIAHLFDNHGPVRFLLHARRIEVFHLCLHLFDKRLTFRLTDVPNASAIILKEH